MLRTDPDFNADIYVIFLDTKIDKRTEIIVNNGSWSEYLILHFYYVYIKSSAHMVSRMYSTGSVVNCFEYFFTILHPTFNLKFSKTYKIFLYVMNQIFMMTYWV